VLLGATCGVAFAQPSSPTGAAALPAVSPTATGLLGVPSAGFTVTGLPLSGQDVARAVTSDLSSGSPCYNRRDGFVIVATDPADVAKIKGEINLSQSSAADPSTRLTNQYVPPDTFVNGSWSSNGTSATVTLRVVDATGHEVMSSSATGPVDSVLNLNAKAASDLGSRLCCKGKTLSYARSASIEIDAEYDIPHPMCSLDHQSVKGRITLSLDPAASGPRGTVSYAGDGTTAFKSDSECQEGAFMHIKCAIRDHAKSTAAARAFPACDGGTMQLEVTSDMDCTTVDNMGTHPWTLTAPASYPLKFQDGYVLNFPLAPQLVGYYRLVVHLK